MRLLLALLLSQLIVFQAFAQSVTGPQHSGPPLNVNDGSTSCYPYSIAVSSGTLACSNGIATITTGGGGGSGTAVSISVTQTAHGFVAGDLVKVTGVNTYAKAEADTSADAEAVGMVSAVADADHFTLTTSGQVSGLSGLTAGTVYFLSPTSAGAYTATPPTTIGQINKPMMVATSTTSIILINYRGYKVASSGGGGSGTSNTIDVAQTAHGFAVGDIVKVTGTDTYAKAKADNVADAEAVGIVTVVTDANNFSLTLSGQVTTLSGLTAGTVYFLDPSTAGNFTATAPSTVGQVNKPMLVATSTTAEGASPAYLHFISRNFSPPRSKPNPASVSVS